MPGFLHKKVDFNSTEFISFYDECSLWASRFGALLLEHIPLKSNSNVLDVGCGPGFPLFELAHQLGKGSQVTGIDTWEEAIQLASWKKAYYELDNVTVLREDAANMPFRNASFDLVVSNLGINNFKNPAAAFAECHRVLKPGGKIIITTNLCGHMQQFYECFATILQELDKAHLIPRLKQQEEHRGTKESISELFTHAGFTINKIVEDEFHLRYLNGTAFFNHFFNIIGFLAGWRSILNGENEGIVFSALEHNLNQVAEANGELQMRVPMLLVEGVR